MMALGNYVTVTNRDRMATAWRARVSDQKSGYRTPRPRGSFAPGLRRASRPALRTCDTSRELSG